MNKLLLVFVLAIAFIGLLNAKEPSTLIVGTNAEFPPFCYIDNQEIVGFDIDVAKEVAKRLGKDIQFKDMPFDALIPEVVLGQVDFVAAGMSYTDERAKRVLFTKAYLSGDPLVVLSSLQQKLGLEQLHGKVVVVIEGFTADYFISSQPGVQIIRLATQADGFLALKNGRADAFVTAKSTVDAFFEKQDASLFHVSLIDHTGETCALVIPKQKGVLKEQIQHALDEMEKDGTLSLLKVKWKLS